jgi:hypothetical protein
VLATLRWCLGSAHLLGGVMSDDESVGSAGERASLERELPDLPIVLGSRWVEVE